MSDSDAFKTPQRIPKEQLTAYERWELPLLDEQGNEVPREEERDLKPLTAADLEAIRQAAHEDGYREGRDAGYQAGLAEGRAQGHEAGHRAGLAEGREQGQAQAYQETRAAVSEQLARLEQWLAELVQPIRRHEEEVTEALVNLTTALARAVVYRELSMDSSQIRQVVRRALEALPSTADNVRIHVHPDDLEPVREVAERLDAAASVLEDETLTPGGCRVETRHSLVDFTVEKRFQRAVQSMLDDSFDAGDTAPPDDASGSGADDLPTG
jgi:flagellar assembly protein FliH